MGITFRKSVRVGPFRFNLSGSGVGVSVGIPGLRIGTGPRGNYISAGLRGIYYRAALPRTAGRVLRSDQESPPDQQPPSFRVPPIDPTLSQFESVDRGTSVLMHDVSSEDLLRELNANTKRWRLTPAVLILSIATLIAAISMEWPVILFITMTFVAMLSVIAAVVRDLIKKTSVLLFDLDGPLVAAYTDLGTAFDYAASARRIWHVQSKALVYDRKYHAGAGTVIEVEPTYLSKADVPRLKTNIIAPSVRLGGMSLFFFPDRVLVHDSQGYGVIPYAALNLQLQRGTFVLGGESLPSDATVVGYTWRYVNKDGGPDRRFANNPQIPNIAVVDVLIGSSSGLAGTLKFSSTPAAEALYNGVLRYAELVAEISHRKTNPPTLSVGQKVYLWLNNEVAGPYELSDLARFRTDGTVTLDSLICFDGETEWHFCDELLVSLRINGYRRGLPDLRCDRATRVN